MGIHSLLELLNGCVGRKHIRYSRQPPPAQHLARMYSQPDRD